MKLLRSHAFWGLIFMFGGMMFLLQALDVLKGENLFAGLVFGVLSLLFLAAFWDNRSQWWFILPGMLFLGIGAGLVSEAILPTNTAHFLQDFFILGCLGLGFWLVFWISPINWWAIIPGGVLITLAIVSVLDKVYPEKETDGIFLIGLGLTFGIMAILPRLHMSWAYIPAVVLILIGFVFLAAAFSAVHYVWPALLILVGLYVLVRELGF